MQRICLIILLLAPLVFAQTPLVQYAGTTNGSATYAYPTWASSGAGCTVNSAVSSYVSFNLTFPTAGVYEIAVMAEKNFKSGVEAFIYTAFDAANGCANLYLNRDLARSSGGGPVIDDWVYFPASTVFYFVVTGGSPDGGIFAINIFPPVASNATTPAGPYWPTAQSDSSGDCSLQSGNASFGTYQWNQTVSGFYDLIAAFFNDSDTSFGYTYLVIYNGSISAAGLSDPCNATAVGAQFYYGYYDSGKQVTLPYVFLTGGVTYTAVISSYSEDDYGNWGLEVIPTRVRFPLHSSPNYYAQPERNTYPCEASTSADSNNWGSSIFNATQNFYLLDTQNPPSPFSYFDTYSFMYRGNNAGDVTASPPVPPVSCPATAPLVSDGDTGDITPVFAQTVIGQNYTVVVSQYSPSTSPLGTSTAYVLYLFTGNLIGVLPSTSTGATTGAATTGGATGTTGGATGTSTNTTRVSSTTSSASKVAFTGLAVAAVAAVFM